MEGNQHKQSFYALSSHLHVHNVHVPACNLEYTCTCTFIYCLVIRSNILFMHVHVYNKLLCCVEYDAHEHVCIALYIVHIFLSILDLYLVYVMCVHFMELFQIAVSRQMIYDY